MDTSELEEMELSFSSPLEPTLTVREVNDAICDAIATSFPSEVWVKGEVQRLNFHSSGHVYFNLVDSDSRGSGSCSIPVSLFKNTIARVQGNIREILAEDREVRILVKPDFYAPYGKMSLVVRGVDTAFTLGQLAIARRELLEKLTKEGILRANADTYLDELATNVVLITAHDSAAYHDVTDHLQASGIGFRVRVITALMQGNGSAASVTAALSRADRMNADVVLLCRGGGAKSDLSSFDDEKVARAITAMHTPVLTGLGHQIDVSVADMVAYASVKTPTACAQLLIERVKEAMDVVEGLFESIDAAVTNQLDTLETRLDYISSRLGDANVVLERATAAIDAYRIQVSSYANSSVSRQRDRLDNCWNSIARRSEGHLDSRTALLSSWKQLVVAHDPQRVLERGYSFTTDAQGKLVSSVTTIKKDSVLTTRLADGEVESTVIKVKENT